MAGCARMHCSARVGSCVCTRMSCAWVSGRIMRSSGSVGRSWVSSCVVRSGRSMGRAWMSSRIVGSCTSMSSTRMGGGCIVGSTSMSSTWMGRRCRIVRSGAMSGRRVVGGSCCTRTSGTMMGRCIMTSAGMRCARVGCRISGSGSGTGCGSPGRGCRFRIVSKPLCTVRVPREIIEGPVSPMWDGRVHVYWN
ncbi:hypothetical protein DL93DRAFT_1361602 [Clavulina sp. PMI_390]|nr:hypothetical protein DL93DRAFT_1361602 [Clavulina sp. PMI_390]